MVSAAAVPLNRGRRAVSEEPVPYLAFPGDFPEAERRRAIMDALRARQAPAAPPPLLTPVVPDAPLAAHKMIHQVFIDGRRTSLRLEADAWEALILTAAFEGMTVNALLTALDRARAPDVCRMTEAARCFPLRYLRRLAGL